MIKTALLTLATVGTLGVNTAMANNIKYDVIYNKGYIISNVNDIKQKLENLGINILDCDINNLKPNFPNLDQIFKPDTDQNFKPDTDQDIEQSAFAAEVVKLVNEQRKQAGLSELSVNTNISSAALTRAKEIEKSFSHTRPNGTNFGTVLTENNVSFKGSGENIAWGQTTPQQVMEGWLNSPGHRANILNPKFTSIGVGHYQNSKGVNYWTQLFTY